MCNLYRLNKRSSEVAKWFEAINELGGANLGEEVYPGYPGAVIADGKLQQMTWGFPLVLKSKATGKLLNQQRPHRQARQLHVALQLRGTALPDPDERMGRGRRSQRQDDPHMAGGSHKTS